MKGRKKIFRFQKICAKESKVLAEKNIRLAKNIKEIAESQLEQVMKSVTKMPLRSMRQT